MKDNIMCSRKVIFNHCYVLKHDLKRTYIYTRKGLDVPVAGTNSDWISKIHPIYAMIFALLSEPIDYNDAIKELSYFLDIESLVAEDILSAFLDRDEPFYSKYDGVISQFPKNVIIDVKKSTIPVEKYSPLDFRFSDIDLKQERAILAPQTAVLMPNSTCSTNCIYCYADKHTSHSNMDFARIKTIIEECRKLRLMNISITGGDLFVYEYWRELLDCLVSNGFMVGLLSTKTPILKEEDVQILKEKHVRLQFSMDSVNVQIIKKLIGMPIDYLEKVKQTFMLFEKVGIKVRVATVLTTINASPDSLKELYNFIREFPAIDSWTIRVANKSLYSKKQFEALRLSKEMLEEIDKIINEIKQKEHTILVSWDRENNKYYFQGKFGSKSFRGARCSANFSNIMILPDGKVTICEQLYWNPKYIIGDLTKQSVTDAWNSERALELAFPVREKIRDESPCKTCEIFDECYAFPNRCIVDVLKGYGNVNDDFPDPRCSKAPAFFTELRPC